MKKLKLTKSEDLSHLIGEEVVLKDEYLFIDEDVELYFDGKKAGVYKILDPEIVRPFEKIVKETKFAKSSRLGGLPTQSATYGALPRIPMRNDYCRFTTNSTERKDLLIEGFKFSKVLDEIYIEHFPDLYEKHKQEVEAEVEKDWLVMKGSPHTNIYININHAMKYHRDRANWKDVMSNVMILKEGVEGGHLVFPEYKLVLSQSNGALGIFDGQNVLHGVSPIKMEKEDGHRASVVFFSASGLKHCYPFQEELERYEKKRTEYETKERE